MEENKKNEKNKQKVEYRVLMEGQKEDPDGYLDTFPIGYRFCPTDRELIIHYLKPKNLNQSIPISCIKTVPVYDYTPQKLTEIFKLSREKKWYFFTQLNSSFSSRKAGNGCWKNDRSAKPIDIDDEVVGYKKFLCFEERSPRVKTEWRMKEYRYHKESDLQRSSTANEQGDWILCKMHTAEYDKDDLQQEGGTMSTRVPDGVPNTGPKMQNENPLQLTPGPHSSGLQSSNSKISAIEEQNSYWDSIPPGYRFCPTDEELIVHYLMPKRLSKDLPENRIKDVNLYDYQPQELTEKFEPVQINEWYFFTKSKPKFEDGKKKERQVGNGHWKRGKENPINSNGRQIGFKRSFTFYEYELDQSSTSTNWIMYEYELVEESAPTSMGHQEKELSDLVLCIIHNSQEAKQAKKKRKRIDEGTETADAKEEPNKA